jgi:PPP family 3-phenylpropionic acid transporter
VTPAPPPRFARLYLHLFASAACVLPVTSFVLATSGWGPADIGIATALLGIAGTVSAPAWGRLDDRADWAFRAAILLCAGAAVAAALTLGRLPHVATWAALALFGAGEGPLDALLTTRVLASAHHGGRLGQMRSFGSIGWVLGLGIAATVLSLRPDHPGWTWLAAAAVAVTAPRVAGRGQTADRPRPPEDPPAVRLPLGRVLAVVGLVFPSALAMSGLIQFTAGWAHTELSAGPFLAVAPIALSAVLELPVFPWVDRLVATRSPLAVTVLAGPPLALATVLLAVWPSSVTMLAVQPLVAVSFALGFMGQSRLLAQAVPAARQGSAQTLGSALSLGCGGLLAGIVGGRLAQAFGYQTLFVWLAAVALAGTVVGCGAWAWSRRALVRGSRFGAGRWLLTPVHRPVP